MKILMFIDSLGSGGAQKQLIEIAKEFKANGHSVSFLTYHNINFFLPELNAHNIPVKILLEKNYVKRLFKIRNEIRSHKADAVISFLQAANFMATIAGFPFRKWKLIVGERSANPAILRNKKLKFYRIAHFFADYVVANSYANLKIVRKANPCLSNKKLKVIYNGIEIPSNPIKTKQVSQKLNIVVAASYRYVKNLEGLIRALEILPSDYKSKLNINWYGSIASDPSYYQIQKNLINRLGLNNVLIVNDETHDINEKYIDADFIGLFSHYEGFPNTICEAMAFSKPVIVSMVSDIPLFIKEDENGFLCDSKESKSIRNALIKAINSSDEKRKYMGLKNSQIVQNNFSKKNIYEQYYSLLK